MAIRIICVVVTTFTAASAFAQAPTAATFITAEQVKAVNETAGIDKQIVVVDVGKMNQAVGIVHRGPAAGMLPGTGEPCGERTSTAPERPLAGITHDHQTETYVILSGGGTLVTGGKIVNGRKSAPDSEITKLLTGPSCSGALVGDVVKRSVKVGDVIIIPAGVPHGWAEIPDHVDYLNMRPDPDRVLPAGYVHPAIKQ